MERLSIKVRNCTAIKVTSALRARKGDYILVAEDGTASSVTGRVYHALKAQFGETKKLSASGEEKTPYGQGPIGKASQKYPRNLMRGRIVTALKIPMLTGVLCETVLEAKDTFDGNMCGYIAKICNKLERDGEIEFVHITAPDRNGNMRRQKLWAETRAYNKESLSAHAQTTYTTYDRSTNRATK